MSQTSKSNLHSAGLVINSTTGEVSSLLKSPGPPVRLSPVNKRVLLALLQHAGTVVSRQTLFDSVWPNQVVSDDALTRCISDLRSQLKPLTEADPLIETIPKTGYRWHPAIEPVPIDTLKIATQLKPAWLERLKPIAVALMLSLMLLWGLIGLLYWWSKPAVVSLVILPTQQTEVVINSAVEVSEVLKTATRHHEGLQYLSQYAIQAHTGSPFPYFSHQFGVRWFIESHLVHEHKETQLTLNLIDAKTALVIYSSTGQIKTPTDIDSQCQTFVNFVAEL